MEAAGGAGGRRAAVGRAEASPERGRPTTYALSATRPAPARPMRKVQIIYYLCRNGQLEHPHFMELAQHPHQPLRLKDVMDRLTLLRGKGMPALFSWSCKRNYKNGYVWNDLSENDVIYPSDGVEYVLKGSEIFPGCSSDRFQHLRVTDRSPTKPLALPRMSHKQYAVDSYRDDAVEDREDDELGYPYHHRRTASSGRLVGAARTADKAGAVSARTTNRSRPVELPVEETSPPSSTSSDKPPAPATPQPGRRASSSDLQLQEPEPSRPASMLLQLIVCGSTAPAAAGGGGGGQAKCRAVPRRSCGLVSRLSARGGADEDDEEEDEVTAAGADLGRRFGNLAVQDKEYFSGSIVEGAGGRGTPLPASSLKRSNSYNEERSCRPGAGAIGEETMDEQMEGDGGIRGRCIPGRKKPPPQK